MRLNYKYALVDGNWVLARNFYAMGGKSGVKVSSDFASNLAASVTSSILNMVSSFNIEKIIILWDTPPYTKQSLLKGSFKESRVYMTEELANEIEDPEERESALIDAHNLQQRSTAKRLVKQLGIVGLPSIWVKGYEADDLAYLLSKSCEDNNEDVLLVSIDSDWGFWMNKTSAWWNPKKEVLTTYEDKCKEINLPKDMTLFRYKVLYDSFYGSHNDLSQTILDDLWNLNEYEAFKKFDELGYSDELFYDKNLARAQIESYNFSAYPNSRSVTLAIDSMDYIGEPSNKSKVAKVSNNLLINLNTDSFTHYYSTLNPSLFKE